MLKILEIDYDYYYYPQGITSVNEFIEHANEHYHSFIELTQLETDYCVFPYLIQEDTTQIYINVANLNKIREVEATVLTRADYEARLKQIMEEKCIGCVHYHENSEGDNLAGHREKMSLDGKCSWYEKKEG